MRGEIAKEFVKEGNPYEVSFTEGQEEVLGCEARYKDMYYMPARVAVQYTRPRSLLLVPNQHTRGVV